MPLDINTLIRLALGLSLAFKPPVRSLKRGIFSVLKSPCFPLAIAAMALVTGCQQNIPRDDARQDIIWYQQPAQEWEEALPLGNGRLGVMVFGGTKEGRIQLNDDSLWPADMDWDEPEGSPADLERIRALLFEGRNKEADQLFVEKFSRKGIVRSHQTLGDLFIALDHGVVTDYRRQLDLRNAMASVSYRSDGALVEEKVIVSHPHRAVVIELATESAGGLNGKISLSRPMDEGYPTVQVETTAEGLLVMKGQVTQRSARFDSKPAPILQGVAFEACLKIDHDGGEVVRGEDFLALKEVNRATLYLVSNSSFYHNDYESQNAKDLSALEGLGFDEILGVHVEDHRSFYDRTELQLPTTGLEALPTDERIANVKAGKVDPGLEALLFQYGRYLLISSSRPGTNPANLQGLWNDHIVAPWNADYHLNINLQMNYWLANATNLAELNGPLFDYVDRLVENGQVTASKNFGCRGTFIPHATDLWAPTWLRAPRAYWGCSVGAGGWLMQHYWDHFEYTGDTVFLQERVFPALEKVAAFYSDWVITDPRDGSLISAPSTSPENRYINAAGDTVATCLGSAMDQQIIAEVFDNYIQSCSLLDRESSLLQRIVKQRKQLRPGVVLDSKGRILEWDREYDEPEPGHRHMSHLYAFHPGKSISKERTPVVFEAVRKTLDHRLANGGAGTGWSRAWLINCSARLLDGDKAHEHIQLLLQKSIYDNLFDAHPPFQIDGNFGYSAGVAEMLVQSHEENTIRLLPALPSAWASGHVKGLKARGGFTIDMYWADHVLERAVIQPGTDSKIDLMYKEQSVSLSLERGQAFTFYP